jgi:hypothetical protein
VDQNVDLLSQGIRHAPRRIVASAMGFSASDALELEKALVERFSGSIRDGATRVDFASTCATLFEQHRLAMFGR